MTSDVFEEIKSFLSQEIGTNKFMERNTRLYEDLRIDGDDAFELMQKYKSVFKVDMTHFDYNLYFAPEGIDLIGAVMSVFKKGKPKLKSITIGDLERAAISGAWKEQ